MASFIDYISAAQSGQNAVHGLPLPVFPFPDFGSEVGPSIGFALTQRFRYLLLVYLLGTEQEGLQCSLSEAKHLRRRPAASETRKESYENSHS